MFRQLASVSGLALLVCACAEQSREARVPSDQVLPLEAIERADPEQEQTALMAMSATISAARPSLIAAVSEAGEAIQLALALADVFSGSIDFGSDLQPGDAVEALFEKSTTGRATGYGPVLGARFVADGREHEAYRWIDPVSGRPAYYDAAGRALKRFFLKSPLRIEPRITSGFSKRRFHPIHRAFRPHLGVDFGAPYGSAVVSVASGVVVSAGWAGAGGKQIRIRHAGGYESYYLHLSSFARGIRSGARVAQGQAIGRVGATGSATGPHLDYRLRRNGVFVNPRAEHSRLPPGQPIDRTHLASFFAERDQIRQWLSASDTDGSRAKPDAVQAIQ